MRITSAHLEAVKTIVTKASGQVTSDTQALAVAADKLKESHANLRAVAGAFDILAAGFVSDSDVEEGRVSILPDNIQKAIGYEKPKPKPEPVPSIPSDQPTK